jgi:SAM-dependent methyltransferase
MADKQTEIEIQRKYYAATAGQYDAMHLDPKDEHYFALSFLSAVLEFLDIRSVLDIGAGTGRAIQFLKSRRPELRVLGIEPVKELRDEGISKGLSEKELIAGDGTDLQFVRGEFDLVCEFGVLHHVRRPDALVAEMLRVSRKAIFISDSNNFGQGSFAIRSFKQLLDFLRLWPVANLVKTKGKGYTISEGDGLAYSYSVFNSYKQIKAKCRSIHLLNTQDGLINPYRTASHVALLGIKQESESGASGIV